MNRHQTWYTNIYLKIGSVSVGVLAKLNKCNGPNKRFKMVTSVYSFGEKNILSLKLYNVNS